MRDSEQGLPDEKDWCRWPSEGHDGDLGVPPDEKERVELGEKTNSATVRHLWGRVYGVSRPGVEEFRITDNEAADLAEYVEGQNSITQNTTDTADAEMSQNTVGYVIPSRWDDAVHEYQTEPITRAIIGHFASQARARDAYWLWNHLGDSVEVPFQHLGIPDPAYYNVEYPVSLSPEDEEFIEGLSINDWGGEDDY